MIAATACGIMNVTPGIITLITCLANSTGFPDSFRNGRHRGSGNRRSSIKSSSRSNRSDVKCFPARDRRLHRYLRSRARDSSSIQGWEVDIGREKSSPRREKKFGQQSGGEHVLFDGFPEKSVESAQGSQMMTSDEPKSKENKKMRAKTPLDCGALTGRCMPSHCSFRPVPPLDKARV